MSYLNRSSLFSTWAPSFGEFDASIILDYLSHPIYLPIIDGDVSVMGDLFIDESTDARSILTETLFSEDAYGSSRRDDESGTGLDSIGTGYSLIAGDSDTLTYLYVSNDDVNVILTKAVYSDYSGNTDHPHNQFGSGFDALTKDYSVVAANIDIDASGNRLDAVDPDGSSDTSLVQDQYVSDENGIYPVCGIVTTKPYEACLDSYGVSYYYDANGDLLETVYSDGAGNTSRTDANGDLTETVYSDGAGNTSRTLYQSSVDDNGVVTSSTVTTTYTDSYGSVSTYSNSYDYRSTLTESFYSDSLGNTNRTLYQSTVGPDGSVSGVTLVVTNTDTTGNSYSYTNHYDANWNLTESLYSDSAGNSSHTQYKSNSNGDGVVTGFSVISISTDAYGTSFSYTHHYDLSWNLTESVYSDSAGNRTESQYQCSFDDDGVVTGYVWITTSTDATGYSYSQTNNYDANRNLTESLYSDNDALVEISSADEFVFNAEVNTDSNVVIDLVVANDDDIWNSDFSDQTSLSLELYVAGAIWSDGSSNYAVDSII